MKTSRGKGGKEDGKGKKKKPPPPPPKQKPKPTQPQPAQHNERGSTRRESFARASGRENRNGPLHVPVGEVQIQTFAEGECPDDLIKLSKLEEGFIVGGIFNGVQHVLIL